MRVALAAGLALTVLGLGIVLSRSPLTLAGTNGIPANPAVAFIQGNTAVCQGGGTIPPDTSSIRVSLSANVGPEVSLEVLSGSTVVTEGRRASGWGIDETVTVPVRPVPQMIRGARVCWTTGPAVEGIQVNGANVRTPNARRPVVWLRMEYLRPGSSSWLSLASSVARHMGIAHAPGGTWVALLLIVLMLAAATLTSRLLLGERDV